MLHQTENTNKEIDFFFLKKMETLELESSIKKIKFPLEGLNSRFKLAKERILAKLKIDQ